MGIDPDMGIGPEDMGILVPEDLGIDMTPPTGPLDCTGTDDRCLFVASTLSIGTEEPGTGRVPGFNLDGRISDATDDLGCNEEDWVSPEGVLGIDNQFATLVPTLEAALGQDLQDAIDDTIADGTFILLIELEGVEATNDDTVTVDVALGSTADGDPPTLDGSALAPAQAFRIDTTYTDDAPAVLRGGVLEVNVPALPLFIPVDATTSIELVIRSARIRATVTGIPSLADGLIGGSVDIDELIATVAAVAPDIDEGLIRTTLEGVSDLEPDSDGICQAVSVGVTFEGVEANEG